MVVVGAGQPGRGVGLWGASWWGELPYVRRPEGVAGTTGGAAAAEQLAPPASGWAVRVQAWQASQPLRGFRKNAAATTGVSGFFSGKK